MRPIACATGRALCVAAMICGVATLAWSHHAAAPVFDMNAEKTVRGVVKRVDWTNPHIWIWLDVQNASGQAETWGFEGMESQLSRAPRLDADVAAARHADHRDVPAAPGRESRRHVHDGEARGRQSPDERRR